MRNSGDRVEKSNDEVWEEILKLDVGNYPLYTCINEQLGELTVDLTRRSNFATQLFTAL